MAVCFKPNAAERLIKALKSEVGLPIQLHTHDTGRRSHRAHHGGVSKRVSDAMVARWTATSGKHLSGDARVCW